MYCSKSESKYDGALSLHREDSSALMDLFYFPISAEQTLLIGD